MAERYPGNRNESEISDSEKDKKESSSSRRRVERVKPFASPIIEKSTGYTPVKAGENLKQLGPDIGTSTETMAKPPEPLTVSPETFSRKPVEKWQQVSPEDMQARAAVAETERLVYYAVQAGEHSADQNHNKEQNEASMGKVEDSQANHNRGTGASNVREHSKMERDESKLEDSHEPAELPGYVGSERQPVDVAENDNGSMPELPDVSPVEPTESEPFAAWPEQEYHQPHTTEWGTVSDAEKPIHSSPQHSFAAPTASGANFRERVPREPSVDGSGGNSLPPNQPPTAEGGDYSDDPFQYGFGGNYAPNPNILHNPWVPAGGLTDPAIVANLNAQAAQQELDSLRHSSREAGLAGAIGVLGLGLIADHLWARRRFKKQKRQLSRQSKELQKTNQSLYQEKLAHQATARKLESVSLQQQATNDQLRTVQTNQRASMERVPNSSLLSATAAAELAAKVRNKPELVSPLTNQALTRQLQHNRELGRAIKRNPELRDVMDVAGVVAAHGEAHQASTESKALNNVGTHERLLNQYQDASSQSGLHRAGADTFDISTTSSVGQEGGLLPQTQTQVGTTLPQPDGHRARTKPWAWATIAVLLALGLIFLFAH